MRLTVAEGIWRGGTDAAKVPAPVLPSQDSRLPKSGFFGSGQHNQLRPFPQPIRRGVRYFSLRCGIAHKNSFWLSENPSTGLLTIISLSGFQSPMPRCSKQLACPVSNPSTTWGEVFR
jgi:hypothetical protein